MYSDRLVDLVISESCFTAARDHIFEDRLHAERLFGWNTSFFHRSFDNPFFSLKGLFPN